LAFSYKHTYQQCYDETPQQRKIIQIPVRNIKTFFYKSFCICICI